MKWMSIFVVRKLVFTINAVLCHGTCKMREFDRQLFSVTWRDGVLLGSFTFKLLKWPFYLGFSHMFIVDLRTDSVASLKLVAQTTRKWLENNVWNDDVDDDGGIGVVWFCCRRIARERLGKAWHRPVTYYKTKNCSHRLRLVSLVKVVYFDPYDKKAASYD